MVIMVDTQEEINHYCGVAPPGYHYEGCELPNGTIVVSNPCQAKEVNDTTSFAHLLCHEKAHLNGWDHGPAVQ